MIVFRPTGTKRVFVASLSTNLLLIYYSYLYVKSSAPLTSLAVATEKKKRNVKPVAVYILIIIVTQAILLRTWSTAQSGDENHTHSEHSDIDNVSQPVYYPKSTWQPAVGSSLNCVNYHRVIFLCETRYDGCSHC